MKMLQGKRRRVVAAALIVVVVIAALYPLLQSGILNWTPATEPTALTPEEIRKWPPLCVITQRDVDFTVLQDVMFILTHYSVFMSPVFEEVFGKQAKSQAYLMRQSLETIFAFLAVPKDQIPQWATQMIEQEINAGTYNYAVFNDIYNKLIQDPQYTYLQEPQQKEQLLKVAIEGIIKALGDPFAYYFTPEIWQLGIAQQSMGTYRGLGVTTDKNEDGAIVLTTVMSGSPAEKAGLKPGDIILAVDGKSTADCTINQFILHIKTRTNPVMKLTVQRGGTDEIVQITVKMEEIKVQNLFTWPGVELPDGRGSTATKVPYLVPLQDKDKTPHPEILYIKITEFTIQVATDLKYVLENLDMSQFEGVIVDLRENPGGLLSSIVDITDYFLPGNQLMVTSRDADGTVTEYRQDKYNFIPPDMPVAILVDKNSASGSEVFAAAMRDNGRGVIIGRDERTAGKGSVNRYFELRKGTYGGLYVSIGLWYSPAGEFIETQDLDGDGYFETGGIKPDMVVKWTNDDYIENQKEPAWYDPTVFAAIDYVTKTGVGKP